MHRTIKHMLRVFAIIALVLLPSLVVNPRTASAAEDCNAGTALVPGSFLLTPTIGGATATVKVSNATTATCYVLITFYANIKYAPSGLTYLAAIAEVSSVPPTGGTATASFSDLSIVGFSVTESPTATAVLHHFNPACPTGAC